MEMVITPIVNILNLYLEKFVEFLDLITNFLLRQAREYKGLKILENNS